jgi:hypothetical protein
VYLVDTDVIGEARKGDKGNVRSQGVLSPRLARKHRAVLIGNYYW